MEFKKISDLAVDPDAILTPTVIKALVKIVDEEFSRQSTLYNVTRDAKRENILQQYRKTVGFDKLDKAYTKCVQSIAKLSAEKASIERSMHVKGLNSNGDRHLVNYHDRNLPDYKDMEKAIKKLDHVLTVADEHEPNIIRAKIVARLLLSTTVGEAMVILREVLGNGIIPGVPMIANVQTQDV